MLNTEQQIVLCILEVLQRIGYQVGSETELSGLGSVPADLIDIALRLEREFTIRIPNEIVLDWKTVGDVIATVKELTENG